MVSATDVDGLTGPPCRPVDERAHDARVEVGILGEGLVDAIPARLGGEIGRVAVHPAQPDGAPLRAHHGGQRLHRRRRAEAERGGGDARFLRELGERAGARRDAEARVGLVVIAGVVLEHDGNAQSLALGEGLDGVGELRHLPRRDRDAAKRRGRGGVTGIAFRLHHVAQHEAAHLLRLDERGRRRRQRAAAAGVQRVDEHEPGLLLERHAAHQIADARLDRPAPVLVGIELAAAVGVLEAQAVHREHGAAADADAGLRLGADAGPGRESQCRSEDERGQARRSPRVGRAWANYGANRGAST